VAIAAGEIAFAPLSEPPLKSAVLLGSKLMGQINLVQDDPVHQRKRILHFDFGRLNDEPIFASVAASAVSGALEGFVRAAHLKLPKGLRINVVSPYDPKKKSEARLVRSFPA